MLKPVGPLSPRVYWRRRALLIAAAVLSVITISVLLFGGGGDEDADAAGPSSASSIGPREGSGSPVTGATVVPSTAATLMSTASSTANPTSTAAAVCVAAGLRVGASTSAPTYPVGASPGLNLVLTNISGSPCIADLSDANIELLVYFGDARVWGSHDCNVEPGSSPQTMPVDEPVSRQIVWSGLSSNPGCTATRQRVAAGTYTLQPQFAGQAGTPVTFTIA